MIERAANRLKRDFRFACYTGLSIKGEVSMNPERRGLILVVVVFLISGVPGAIYGPSVRATTATTDDYQTAVRDFTSVLSVVQANYAEPVDADKAVYQGAIPGMLRMLDPHSNFFDARQFALLREHHPGKYYCVSLVLPP